MQENEIWLPLKGYENHYQVSNLGRVRSIDRIIPARGSFRRHKGVIKSATPHYKNKYLSVLLKVNQVEKRVFVHRIVAEHFIPNPENKPEVNHKRGDKNDNRAISLEWVTALENTRHSIKMGYTSHSYKAVIAIQDTAIIEFKTQLECAKYFGVVDSWIGVCIKKNKELRGFQLYAL